MSRMTDCKPLHSKAKEIIHSVSEYFIEEVDSVSFLERTSRATGVSVSTVKRVRQEKKANGTVQSPKRSKRGPYKPLDDFDCSVVRHKVAEFYAVRKQLPTLRSLHAALVADINFPGSVETLRLLLKEFGYRWRKTKDNRTVLIERENIVALRLEFYARRKEFQERGLEFVYIDETWVDTSYSVSKCWQSNHTSEVVQPCNRGQRIIVVHAGGRMGFIPGALLIYKAKSKTGDYHSEMDGKSFVKWLEEKLLPNLEEPSVIVMDNASYHSMRADKFPTSNSRKADIQDWLTKENIRFSAGLLRPQLLQLARAHRPPAEYTVDQLIRLHGHEVLRLPPYHPDFNPIEMIWSQMKNYVRQHNTTFRYDDVFTSVHRAFETLDLKLWTSCCNHVDKHIIQCEKDDLMVDNCMDSIVINLQDSSDDSSNE